MKKKLKKTSMLTKLGHHEHKYAGPERDIVTDLAKAFEKSPLPLAQKLSTFPRHTRRQDIARFLVKYEIFKLNLPVNGSVIECGVFAGGGLAGWMHFSAILEPYNHTRRVIGFDTFEGFPGLHECDLQHGQSGHLRKGAFSTTDTIQSEIEKLAAIHDRNRPIGHIPKIECVRGDACLTIPKYVADHPHLLVSLLYLDFDIYAPTKTALEHILPRVVKGGIVAFDELNCAEFPGETVALLQTIGLERVELRRLAYDPYISYFVKS